MLDSAVPDPSVVLLIKNKDTQGLNLVKMHTERHISFLKNVLH